MRIDQGHANRGSENVAEKRENENSHPIIFAAIFVAASAFTVERAYP